MHVGRSLVIIRYLLRSCDILGWQIEIHHMSVDTALHRQAAHAQTLRGFLAVPFSANSIVFPIRCLELHRGAGAYLCLLGDAVDAGGRVNAGADRSSSLVEQDQRLVSAASVLVKLYLGMDGFSMWSLRNTPNTMSSRVSKRHDSLGRILDQLHMSMFLERLLACPPCVVLHLVQ